jgi:DNA mismatch repair ATPase MutL
VKSFGFRGEALFSLAQLSDEVVFETKTKGEAIGQR